MIELRPAHKFAFALFVENPCPNAGPSAGHNGVNPWLLELDDVCLDRNSAGLKPGLRPAWREVIVAHDRFGYEQFVDGHTVSFAQENRRLPAACRQRRSACENFQLIMGVGDGRHNRRADNQSHERTSESHVVPPEKDQCSRSASTMLIDHITQVPRPQAGGPAVRFCKPAQSPPTAQPRLGGTAFWPCSTDARTQTRPGPKFDTGQDP